MSVLKRVLCRRSNMTVFFMKMFNSIVIKKKLGNSLQLIGNVPLWVQFRTLGGTVLITDIYHK